LDAKETCDRFTDNRQIVIPLDKTQIWCSVAIVSLEDFCRMDRILVDIDTSIQLHLSFWFRCVHKQLLERRLTYMAQAPKEKCYLFTSTILAFKEYLK